MKKQFGLLLLVAVLFFACANQKNEQFDFSGKTIQLVELDGVAYDTASTVVPVLLTFAEEDLQVAGTAGCNSVFGPYSLENNQIKFENLGLTRRLCDEVSNETESKFVEALNSTDNYKFQDGKIYFMKEETVLAVFEVK